MEILAKRLIAFFGLSLILLASGGRADALPGTISMIPNGAVEVRTGMVWRPASGTETLPAGTEVRTSASSTAELRFSDGSRIQLAPGTLFKIDKTDAKEASFSLRVGKIRAAFAGMFSSRVRIRTPTAVAAVRGTVFEMGATEKLSAIVMAEGVLEVTDNQGKQAVLTSEETLRIGADGMEKPRLIGLGDPGALQAVRPYAVHQEMARDATRSMLEDLRNRELKANEAQLGKDIVDAFGRRVRLEEYLLRPDTKSFKVLFLSHRSDRFDWGHFMQTFNSAIPNDLSQVPAIVAGGFLATNQPSNWLTSFEFYATNTVDALKEVMTLGDPTRINFAGYNGGVDKFLWYPESIDYTQTLMGPGVPGGSRVQFLQHQDYGLLNPSLFTWTQRVQPVANFNTAIGDPSTLMVAVILNPASANLGDPQSAPNGGDAVVNLALYNNTNTVSSLPSGDTKADLRQTTTYPDASTVQVEKFLVSNDGKILDFANPTSDIFNKEGTYNLEINIKSSFFQGRDIDVMIAPEILRQKNQQATTATDLKP